jgi:HK97 family phage major capsid protein
MNAIVKQSSLTPEQLKNLAVATSRVYSTITIKAVDDEKREFTGIATTPSTDRVNDIVEPSGAVFQLPLPLLWMHYRDMPVGLVVKARPTKAGIEVTCSIPTVPGPPGLAARLEEAWQSAKALLVRGLSIGFNPIEYSFMDNGGIHFTKWDWLELSLVTIPANADCSITSIKSFYESAAAIGTKALPVVRSTPAGVSAKVGCSKCGLKHVDAAGNDTFTKQKHVCPTQPKTPTTEIPMDIAAKIKGFEATRATKQAALLAILTAAGDMTLDAAQTEQHDTLKGEIEAIDLHLERLRAAEKMNAGQAEVVKDTSGMQARGGGGGGAIAKVTEKLAPGIEFARYAMCLGAAKGDLSSALAIAQSRFPNSERVINTIKAAVSAGTTTDSTWALPLVEYNQFAGDFVNYLRPKTILGQFGQNGIPALRLIPFNVHIRGQTSGGDGYWVGQGAPKPLTKFDFNDVYLGYTKVANIAVLTEELMRFSNPSAEMLVRDSLADALIARLDTDFIDPTKVEVANISPASITYGVAQIQASGTGDADDIRTDVKAAMQTFIAANITPTNGVWIMSATTALALSLMRNALGQKEFPDITMLGGKFEGLPVIVSQYVPTDSNGGFVVLADASEIWLADDGNVVIDASREASLQMLNSSASGAGAPTNNSATPTATSLVSMFQTNSVALRAERWINWKKRRSAAVAVIAHVKWGQA